MKQFIDQTRCEKCAVILSTRYDDKGVLSNAHHQGLIITVIDRSQNLIELTCPNCEHRMACILTVAP